jgi:hypothetical protein
MHYLNCPVLTLHQSSDADQTKCRTPDKVTSLKRNIVHDFVLSPVNLRIHSMQWQVPDDRWNLITGGSRPGQHYFKSW